MRAFGSSLGVDNAPSLVNGRGVWSLLAASDAQRRNAWPAGGVFWDAANMGSYLTLTNGAKTVTHDSNSAWTNVRAIDPKSSGKWYFEVSVTAMGGSGYSMVGIDKAGSNVGTYHGANANGYGYQSSGYRWNNGTGVPGYGATWTNGDVIGIALDFDAGTLTFYKNNVSQGTAYSTGMTGSFFPCASLYASTALVGKFKAAELTYSPPGGHSAWG